LLHGQDLVHLLHDLFKTGKNKLFIERDIEECSLCSFELDVTIGVSVVVESVDVVESMNVVVVVLITADVEIDVDEEMFVNEGVELVSICKAVCDKHALIF